MRKRRTVTKTLPPLHLHQDIHLYHTGRNETIRRKDSRRVSVHVTPMTHVTEVVPGKGALAKFAVQLVQIRSVQFEHLAAVKAEVVRCRGDLVPLQVVVRAGLGKARQFL